jgi:hypothetical protein
MSASRTQDSTRTSQERLGIRAALTKFHAADAVCHPEEELSRTTDGWNEAGSEVTASKIIRSTVLDSVKVMA